MCLTIDDALLYYTAYSSLHIMGGFYRWSQMAYNTCILIQKERERAHHKEHKKKEEKKEYVLLCNDLCSEIQQIHIKATLLMLFNYITSHSLLHMKHEHCPEPQVAYTSSSTQKLTQVQQMIVALIINKKLKRKNVCFNTISFRQFGGRRVYLFTKNSNQLDPFASELTFCTTM